MPCSGSFMSLRAPDNKDLTFCLSGLDESLLSGNSESFIIGTL